MPVVNISISSLLQRLSNVSLEEIKDKIPYVGMDIEGYNREEDSIRLEFNPNRPDFASENGIIRALKGIFDIEVGVPTINLRESNCYINVDNGIREVRPFIGGLIAKRSTSITDKELSQLISIQEDLHNGLGRKRKKSSIGIHNFDSIKFPIHYTLKSGDFKFEPLEENAEYSIDFILKNNKMGKEFGNILHGFDDFPILLDDNGLALSFPPIINGNYSKIDLNTKNLFVEVTSKNSNSRMEVLSILSFELAEMNFDIFGVHVKSSFDLIQQTPDLKPLTIKVNPEYINNILGLNLNDNEIIRCLQKSRCSGTIVGKEIECIIPSYRTDILSPIDICEEVAIGYGVYNMTPLPMSLYTSGGKNIYSFIFDAIREVLVGLGFLEVVNTNILSKNILESFSYPSKLNYESFIKLGDSKNSEFDVLRDSMLPSLMVNLSSNIHERYPQKLFELGKIFEIRDSKIMEYWSLGIVTAHNNAEYTEIKAYVESLIKYCFDKDINTPRNFAPCFVDGHSSNIVLGKETLGKMGEIHPQILENFNLRTLVSAAEINLSKLILNMNFKDNVFSN